MSICELNIPTSTPPTLESVLNNGNTMASGQFIDGSIDNTTKINCGVCACSLLQAQEPLIFNEVICDAKLNRAPTVGDNYQGEIKIARQNVDFITSDPASLVLSAPQTKILNLTNAPSSFVLGYDNATGQVSYKPNSSGGGEDLQQTMAIGNATGGLPINWDIGEVNLQKNNVSVLETSSFAPPAPIPPQPPLDVLKTDRPILCRPPADGVSAFACVNDNGLLNFNMQNDGSGILIGTKSFTLMSTDITNMMNALNMDMISKQCTLQSSDNVVGDYAKVETQTQAGPNTRVNIEAKDATANSTASILLKPDFLGLSISNVQNAMSIASSNGGTTNMVLGGALNNANGSIDLRNHANNKILTLSMDQANDDVGLIYADETLQLASNVGKVLITPAVGQDLEIQNLQQVSAPNVLYYDSITNKVTYDVAPGGGSQNLDQVLQVGNDAGNNTINWQAFEMQIRKSNNNVLSTSSGSVSLDAIAGPLYISCGANQPIDFNVGILPSFRMENSAGTCDLTVGGGGSNSEFILKNAASNQQAILSFDKTASNELYINSPSDARLVVANTLNLEATTIRAPNLTNAPSSNIVYYDTVSKAFSYDVPAGGSSTLSQVLTNGNDTAGQAINAASGELLLRKAGANIVATNGSNLELCNNTVLDLVINNATGVKINNLPNASASNIVYYDNLTKDLSFGTFSNPSPVDYSGVLSFPGVIPVNINWSAIKTARTVTIRFTNYDNPFSLGTNIYTSSNSISAALWPSGTQVYAPVLINEGPVFSQNTRFIQVRVNTAGVVEFSNLPTGTNTTADFIVVPGQWYTWFTAS